MQCYSNSRDLSDMVYIDAWYFNKVRHVVFNSTADKFIGYSEYGVRNAEFWNNDTAILNGERADVEGYCKHNAGNYLKVVLDKTGKLNKIAVPFFFFCIDLHSVYITWNLE